MDTTQQTILGVMEALNKRMEQFEGELQNTPQSNTSTTSLAADFTEFKKFTTQILRGFQQELELIAHNVDRLEMHSRRKILLLHGIPEGKQEDCAALVVKLVTNHLNFPDFAPGAINRCQRMGRLTTDKPRPILVKLRDIEARNKIWFSKKLLKGTEFTVSEFLTKSRHQAFMEARSRFGMNKCWTRDGQIHIMGADGSRHRISSAKDLQTIPAAATPKPPQNKVVVAKENQVTSKTRRATARK